ncbi:MAX gene-associated protein isoform X2 [Xiphias gladius]|uniref:MAX gene-associated protein isoform X2 n=1 Tax=Xiphias gladius TaxID=8245 RepID=UPI001A997264|nr:MAX gene-associated protein isoform X2 [Xiphias gladius]
MPSTDSELTSMEDSYAEEDEKGSLTDVPSSAPPTTISASTPPFPTTMTNFTGDTVIENRAVSMTSNDGSSALSSPAEASPAKPALILPNTFEGTVETSPATSHIASASDSLKCTGTSLVSISESLPLLSVLPCTTFGSPDLENDFSAVLTFQGVTVTLENNSVWRQFYSCGTEMILTKQGRRMFPYCRYRLAGLDPERQYSLVLSIVPSDQYKYRWSKSKWEVTGPAEHQAQGLIRAFSHHYSPCKGSEWMGGLVSFYKLKLTNNSLDQEGHIILHSMHRYIPRLHVIPVPDGVVTTPDQPVVMGPESMTFTFPQTEFMAVTTYQNFRITQLKINHNPFAKGFREDGNNSRLNRVTTEAQPAVKTDTASSVLKQNESKEGVVDMSMEKHTVPASLSNVQETRLVLKPIMSTPASKDEPYVPCIRGKHALGELVLVQKRPLVEPREESPTISVTPKLQQGFKEMPKAISMTPTSSRSTPGLSPGSRKRRKKINRRWGNSRGRDWKTAAAASPKVVHSPSLTVALQPELDDVEGLLFVSFTSKEALEVHVRKKPANSSVSPVSLMTQKQLKETVEVIPETDEEKIARLEAILLQDLQVLKHRQVIHPVLQEVGLKLSSIDPLKSIDLQYLGVHLPLPPTNLPQQDKELPFISRTGKTSDMTKIKGWKNKFIKSKETSPPDCDGLQKNLSAFCSNMLDEYLESEAQQISERAAAFSTNPEGSVAYQLPVKSSSYVKTLDSVLKHRNGASRFPVGANRPCPLSHKPLLYSALTSPAPPLASPATRIQAEAQAIQHSTSSNTQPGALLTVGANAASGSSYTSAVSQRSSTYHPGVSQRSAMSFGQNQGLAHRSSGLTKVQLKLLQMEIGALNEGLSRTELTPDRVSVALSAILTKQMLPSQVLKVARYPKYKAGGPECGQDFCRLGCVCSSLQHLNRGPLHCRRPECMFGCACFKRKITKQISAGEGEQQVQPVYSMTNMEHAVQPHPGSHANKLWNRKLHDVDPEPLFAPTSPPHLVPSKAIKRSSVPRPTQPIREEDKDPVYKYLESMMTCARVREFNSKPPPEVTIEPKIPDTCTANTITKLQKTATGNRPRHYYRPIKTLKKAEKTCQESTASETEARKQIQIQSACQWDKDHKMVLEALCRRMNQNRLSKRFCIGPYRICPVAKIFMRKPSGSIVTYRVHISKPSKASDNEKDEFDDCDEEKLANKSFDGDINADEEDGQTEESEMRLGVMPFLGGVLRAGRLRARTKPVGCQAYGLIQVNGKSYNQARLLLGSMGSLHPANRLAAYVTGRLHAPGNVFHKKNNTTDTLHIKAAGTVVPPIITARRTTDLKTPTQPPVQFQPDSGRKRSITLPQHSQNSSTINSVQKFVSSQRSSISTFQNSSTSSPVSLTVSPSLKTPSFLGQSGTYSFRICPPANQSTRGQNPTGVSLPGGFTLIQLPKPEADGDAQLSETVNTANMAGMDKPLSQRDALFNFGHLAAGLDADWLGLDTLKEGKDLSSSRSVEPGSSPELICDEKMPSDESDEANSRQVESNLDIASEGLSSDSSDYCGEGDKDEEPVDIETVEEVRQGIAIAKMKEAVIKALQESRDSSDDFGSARELNMQDQMDDEHDVPKDKKRRKNHTVLERQRRSEQRNLFDKLQTVLQSDPRAPRLRLLSLALKEIQNLVETSKCLEEKKKRLTQMQSAYVKELSLLSGKSEKLIKHKLRDICKRQKMREKTMKWRPLFSHLLQARAALLQATTPQSKFNHTPLLQPDFSMAPSQASPHATLAENNVHEMMPLLQPNLHSAQSSVHTPMPLPTPQSLPQAVSSLTQAEVIAAPSRVENQPGEPVTSVQVSQHQSKFEDQLEAPGASPVSSTPNSQNPSVCPPQPFALPLIRSKTGRIILPSSLKPTGQGFYTLMVMKAKQNGEEGEDSVSANMQPDVDSKNQEKSFSASDHPPGSESSCILEEDKTTSSNSDPKHSGITTHLAELAFLNKSIYVPSEAVQAGENSPEGGTVAGLNKTLASACLSFNRVHQIPTSVEAELDPDPAVVRRPRGRPRKNHVPPVSGSEKCTMVKETRKRVSESVTPILVKKRPSKRKSFKVTKRRAEDTQGMVSDIANNPEQSKRGRGRPPKKKSARLWSPVSQEGRSPSKSNEDSPVRVSSRFKSPDTKPKASPAGTTLLGDVNTTRPLTRGALGKDFPSAKKRSWIDIEKELEPELEYE